MIRFVPTPDHAVTADAEQDREAAAAEREAAERAREEALHEERRRVIAAGREQGYREGWAAAQRDIQTRLEQPLMALTTALEEKLQSLERIVSDCGPALTQAIVSHAMRLAEAATGAPSVIDRRSLQERLIVEASAECGEGGRLSCRAHPDTLESIADILREMGCAAEPDPTMAVGGIVLFVKDPETNRRIAEWDASVERQVAAIRAQMGATSGDPQL